MKRYWKTSITVVLAGLLTLGMGCGDDEPADDNNQAANANNQDPNNQVPDEVPSRCDDDYDAGELPELEEGSDELELGQEYDMRITEFAFDSGSPGNPLNGTIGRFLDQDEDYPIIVLLELREIDSEEGTLMIRGGAGLHADEPGAEEYVWDDELEEPEFVEGEVDGEGNFQATLPLLNFVATVDAEGELLKTVIPIRDLALDAQLELDDDAPVITEASLTGLVREEEAQDVRIALNPGSEGIALPQILGEGDLNFDYECDGTANAWEMSAGFSAQQTTILD